MVATIRADTADALLQSESRCQIVMCATSTAMAAHLDLLALLNHRSHPSPRWLMDTFLTQWKAFSNTGSKTKDFENNPLDCSDPHSVPRLVSSISLEIYTASIFMGTLAPTFIDWEWGLFCLLNFLMETKNKTRNNRVDRRTKGGKMHPIEWQLVTNGCPILLAER